MTNTDITDTSLTEEVSVNDDFIVKINNKNGKMIIELPCDNIKIPFEISFWGCIT